MYSVLKSSSSTSNGLERDYETRWLQEVLHDVSTGFKYNIESNWR